MSSRPRKKQKKRSLALPRRTIHEYAEAEREVKRIFGQDWGVKFYPKAIKYKYQVGQHFISDGTQAPEGARLFGVVGQGTAWTEAIMEAYDRVAKYNAEQAQQVSAETKLLNSEGSNEP